MDKKGHIWAKKGQKRTKFDVTSRIQLSVFLNIDNDTDLVHKFIASGVQNDFGNYLSSKEPTFINITLAVIIKF